MRGLQPTEQRKACRVRVRVRVRVRLRLRVRARARARARGGLSGRRREAGRHHQLEPFLPQRGVERGGELPALLG